MKYLCSKNRHTQEVIEANCRVRLIHAKKTVLKHFSDKIFILYFNSLAKKAFTPAIKKPIIDCTQLL